MIDHLYLFSLFFPQTQLGNQNLTANVLEVNASQTHRQTPPEASSSRPPSVVTFNPTTFSPVAGSSPASLALLPPADLGPSHLQRPPTFLHCFYKPLLLAPACLIHSNATGSLTTDLPGRAPLLLLQGVLLRHPTWAADSWLWQTDCSETPSPTLGQQSAMTDGITLTIPAIMHVIILLSYAPSFFKQIDH